MSKDPKQALQTAYYKLLTATLDVPVYDEMGVPADPGYPYVIIGGYSQLDWSDKTAFGEQVTVALQVVDRGTQKASRAGLYAVCDSIRSVLRRRPLPFVNDPSRDDLELFEEGGLPFVHLDSFNVLSSIVDNETTLPKELDEVYTYFGSLIRFRHYIEQLEPPLDVLVDANGDILTDGNGIILYG